MIPVQCGNCFEMPVMCTPGYGINKNNSTCAITHMTNSNANASPTAKILNENKGKEQSIAFWNPEDC